MELSYSQLRNSNRKDLKESLPLQKPFTVQVDVTGRCCFKCIQCFQSYEGESKFDQYKIDMTLDIFEKMIKDLAEWPGEQLKTLRMHMTGEPLMNPDFIKMLEIAKKSDVAQRIEFTTNGALLTEEIIEKIIELEVDYIQVSIYSVIQKKHNEVTAVNIDIDRIYNNVKRIQILKEKHGKNKPFVCAKMFFTYTEEDKLFRKTYESICDEIMFQTVFNYNSESEEENLKSVYGMDGVENIAILETAKGKTEKIACPYPFYMLGIKSNGDITPCHLDWEGDTSIGNVSYNSLKEIWEGEKRFEFQKMMLENRREENCSCKKCTTFLYEEASPDNVDGFPVEKLRR